MKNNGLNYTCLFGGGAIRGICYVGVLKAFEELHIQPELLAGSSVGSVFTALMAVGYTADEIKEIFMKVNFELFRDIQFSIKPKLGISKGEVFLEWLRELIESKFYGENYDKKNHRPVTFRDLNKDLVIITTDLTSFECKEFSNFETPDFEVAMAVRISSSMPGLINPIKHEDRILVDGDLQKSLPMWKLSKNITCHDDRILEFRLEGYSSNLSMNAIGFANTIYSCVTALSTNFITDLYSQKDKFDYIVLNTGSVVIVDFNIDNNKREELIKIGYKETKKYFKKTLPLKKAFLLEQYKKANCHLNYLKTKIEQNKAAKAKIRLGEMFIDLCDCGSDVEFYDEIKRLKNNFNKSLGITGLFGFYSLKNREHLVQDTEQLIAKISCRIAEIEEYLIEFPL